MSAKYYKAVTARQVLKTTQEEYETLKAALEADNREDSYSKRGEWLIDYLDGQVHIFASFTEKWWSGPPNRFLAFLGTLIAKNGLAYLDFGAAFTCDMLRMGSRKATIFRIRRNGSVWQPITVW